MKQLAKVFLFHNGKLLLLVRSYGDTNHPGRLDLVGGSVEMDETPLQAVARETQEETGITLAHNALHEIIIPGLQSNEPAIEKHAYYAFTDAPDITLSHEHVSAAWLDPSLALRLFPHPFYGPALQYLIDQNLITLAIDTPELIQ